MSYSSLLGALCLLLTTGLAPLGLAQTRRPEARLELGFQGEVVAERWNPLRLETRDVVGAELNVFIDQGSLKEGETLAAYQRGLELSGGVAVVTDELFIPTWRSFVWQFGDESELVASGALDRRRLNPQRLTLLLSANPSRWREVFPDARLVEVDSSRLPERLVAYDGVERVVLDGSTAAPAPEVLVAAASAGATVLLVEPLPESYRELQRLAGSQPLRLGAGWLVRTEAAGMTETLNELPLVGGVPSDLAALVEPPASLTGLTQLPVLVGAALYVVLTLALLRLAGTPGLLTSLALAGVASVGAWSYLRPAGAQSFSETTLTVGGGALARRETFRSVLTLPSYELKLEQAARPLQQRPYFHREDGLELSLERWSRVDLLERPRLVEASLQWRSGRLHNAGRVPLSGVYVKGLGPQADLGPGASLSPVPSEDAALSELVTALLEAVPNGTALAVADNAYHLSLPPYAESVALTP